MKSEFSYSRIDTSELRQRGHLIVYYREATVVNKCCRENNTSCNRDGGLCIGRAARGLRGPKQGVRGECWPQPGSGPPVGSAGADGPACERFPAGRPGTRDARRRHARTRVEGRLRDGSRGDRRPLRQRSGGGVRAGAYGRERSVRVGRRVPTTDERSPVLAQGDTGLHPDGSGRRGTQPWSASFDRVTERGGETADAPNSSGGIVGCR